MNHSWGENHKTTRQRSSHTNVHGIYSSISNEIASRIERKRGRAMVKANCSNYLCWKSKRAFLPAGSKQHGSKSWRRECTPFLPQVPTLLLLGHHFLAAGFHLGAVCCSLLLREEILIWGIAWETCRPVGSASGVVCLCRGARLNQNWFSTGLFGRNSLENDYPEKTWCWGGKHSPLIPAAICSFVINPIGWQEG